MMISEHLRIVEVKCDADNDTFHNVLRFLDSLNICKLTGTCSFAFYIFAFHLLFVS
jgi:hypothetical protein